MAEPICCVEGCSKGGALRRGMCENHYYHWRKRTPPDQRPVAPRFARDFWDFVTKSHEHGCWTWTGPSDRRGYGRWGRKIASRHSWELANGPIPEGLWILHHCDNPPCVNPNHLYAGTSAENIRDAVVRGRMRGQRKSHCKLGHAKEGDNLVVISIRGKFSYRCRKCENERSRLNQAKRRLDHGLMGFRLTEDEKARIIELGRDGLSHRKIASMVGRSSSSVQRVMQGAGQ